MTTRFELLDPVKGQLPWWPFPYSANGILWRMRDLLRRRTDDELAEIAKEAESLIDTFFEIELERGITQIEADGRVDLFEDGQKSSSGSRQEAHDEYGINDRDNTTELEALDQALSSFFDPSHLEAVDVQDYECIASFALKKLDDFARGTVFRYDSDARKFLRKPSSETSHGDYSLAASYLIEVTDALGRAELRRATEQLSQKYEQKIGRLKASPKLREEIRSELLEQEKQRRQEESAARNDSRHEVNRQVKVKVLSWFAEDPAKFPSAEKAAKHFCGILSEEGIEREQRTVADWIRTYAKETGLRWRP